MYSYNIVEQIIHKKDKKYCNIAFGQAMPDFSRIARYIKVYQNSTIVSKKRFLFIY